MFLHLRYLGFKESRIFQKYEFENADDDASKWIIESSDLFEENCLGRRIVTNFCNIEDSSLTATMQIG